MKICPVCQRTYVDDSLSYCLEDGSVLSLASAAAAPANLLATPAKRSASFLPLLGVFALVAVLLTGVLGIATYFWVKNRNAASVATSDSSPKNQSNSIPLANKSPLSTPTQGAPTNNQNVSANANSTKSSSANNDDSSSSPVASSLVGATFTGSVTNNTVKKTANLTVSVSGSDDVPLITGRISSGLTGRFESVPGRKVSCPAKTSDAASVCYQFSGQISLDNPGSGFPRGTSAPLAIQLAFASPPTRAAGTYEIGLIPKYESMGKQHGSVSLKR